MKKIKKIKIGFLALAILMMSAGAFAFVFGSENGEDTLNEGNTATVIPSKNQLINAEVNRETVSAFVRNLLVVADREDKLKDGILSITERQNNSGSTTAEALEQIENRNALKSFFFGTDYKKLNVLRSELAKTEYQIEQLKGLVAKATNAEAVMAINNQIDLLQDNQTQIKEFMVSKEKKFAVFKWVVIYF